MATKLIAVLLVALNTAGTPYTSSVAAPPPAWHLLRQAEPGQVLTGIACAGVHTCYAAGSVILRTRNGGATWQTLVDQVPRGASGIACPNTATCYVSSMAGYLMITHDGGATWSRRRLSGRSLGAIACPALTTCYVLVLPVYTGQFDVILLTQDGGSHWARHDLGIDRQLAAMACPTTEICYLAGGGYMVRTNDGGRHWAVRNNGMDTGIGTNGSEFTSVTCPASKICYMTSEAYGREWTGASIYRTRDAGKHWKQLYGDANSSGQSEGLRGITCPDARTCYAAGNGTYILHTRDAGSHWDKQPSGARASLNAIDCTPHDTCFAVGASGAVVSNRTP